MLKKYIPFLVIFSSDLFFITLSIFGMEYQGSDTSLLYILYTGGVFFFGIVVALQDFFFNTTKYTINQLMSISIPFIISALFLSSMLFKGFNETSTWYFLLFILWGVPSILMGFYVSKKESRIKILIKLLEPYMFLITIAVLSSSIRGFLLGEYFSGVGGATYQTASYLTAFAFGINLYFIINGNNHQRLSYTNSILYKIISPIFLIIQAILVLSTGGRGGVILILAYIILNTPKRLIHNIDLKKLVKFMLIFIAFILILTLVLLELLKIPMFRTSFNRVFSYVTTSGINFSATSGRDIVYIQAINLIKNAPLFGYGYYGFWNVYTNPHNFFLEVLLQGGIIFLLLVFLGILYLLYRNYKISKLNKDNKIIISIAMYPLVFLMFSSTYTINSIFWFVISYIISYKKNENQNSSQTHNHV